MNILKKIVRRLILWAFSNHIRQYDVVHFISDYEIQAVREPEYLKQSVLNELSIKLAKKLVEEGAIGITERDDPQIQSKEIRFTLYCIK